MRRALIVLPLALALAACRQDPAPEAAPTPAPAPAPAPAEDAAPAPTPAPAAPGTAATGTPAPGEVPRAFLCRGNEPFWALDIGGASALLKTPESETALEGQTLALAGGAWRFEGAPLDAADEQFAALLSPAQCFDTMADGPAMPFSAVVSFPDGRQANGCCRTEYGLDMATAPAADAATKPAEDWSRLLPELLPAVQRCALDAGVATASITKAWPMNQGKIGVRLADAGQARFDCIVDEGRGAIETVEPVDATDQLPGEGEPVWLPPSDHPPVLHCGRVERVSGADAQAAGFLHYRAGCG